MDRREFNRASLAVAALPFFPLSLREPAGEILGMTWTSTFYMPAYICGFLSEKLEEEPPEHYIYLRRTNYLEKFRVGERVWKINQPPQPLYSFDGQTFKYYHEKSSALMIASGMEKEMNIVVQPEGSSLCGQCCLASLGGISLENAIKILGEGRNYPRNLRKGFEKLGLTMGLRSVDSFQPGEVGVVFVKTRRDDGSEATHWIVYDGVSYIDPRGGKVFDYLPWKEVYRYVVSEA